MRSGKLMIASCGMVGLAISYAVASDPQFSSNRFSFNERRPAREGNTYFAKPVPETGAAVAEAETAEVAETAPTKYTRRTLTPKSTPKRPLLSSRDASSVPNYHEELFGPDPGSNGSQVIQAGHETSENRKNSKLVNAQYEQQDGAAERDQIQQVGGAMPTPKSHLLHAEYERNEGDSERGRVQQIAGDEDSAYESSLIHADHQRRPGLTERSHIEQIRGTKTTRPTRTTLIHADHEFKRGTSTRGQIQPLRNTENEPLAAPSAEPADEFESEVSNELQAEGINTFAPAPAAKKSRTVNLTPARKPEFRDEMILDEAPEISAERKAEPKIVPATGSGTTGDGEAQTPQVTVQWVKKGDINVGQECQCDLVVKNLGRVDARDIAVDAYFPASVRLTAAEPRPLDKQDHVSWELKELAAGGEQVIHLTMVPSKRGELATTAFVRFTGAASNVFTVAEPMLALSAKGPKEVMVGDPASQTVTVTNPGTGVAHNVMIEAIIPEGLEHSKGPKLSMEVGSLNPGESRSVRLALGAAGGGEHAVQIRATAEGNLEQECTSFVTVIAPSIEVGIDGPALRYIGRNAVYTLTVTNDGRADSNNVRVLHKVPEGFKFVRADKGGTFDESSRTINWFVGHIDAGERAQLKAELSATELGAHVHRVGAVSENGIRSESELETAVEGTASLVLEIADLNDPVEVGIETAYEVRVRNDGTIPAQNVGISCELPGGVELLGAKGPTEFRSENGLMLFKALGQLDPGKTAVYRINVRGRADGNHRFRARLASDSIKEPLVFEELTKFYGE